MQAQPLERRRGRDISDRIRHPRGALRIRNPHIEPHHGVVGDDVQRPAAGDARHIDRHPLAPPV